MQAPAATFVVVGMKLFEDQHLTAIKGATVLLLTGNDQKKVTLFRPQIKKLFESRGLDSKIEWDKTKMLT